MVEDRIKLIIEKYIAEVKSKDITISKVFLYGSYAYGNPDSNSDIDLLIVSPDIDNTSSDNISAKLWLATEVVNYIIEPIGIGENEFNSNKFSPLLDLVRAKGLEIAAYNSRAHIKLI